MPIRFSYRLAPGALLASLTLVGLAASGCDLATLGLRFSPSPSPSCRIPYAIAAPLFYLDAPASASSGATFSVEPWVLQKTGSWGTTDTPLPETFRAVVDVASRTITVTGQVERVDANPKATCAIPMLAPLLGASTLSIPVSAPEGLYTIRLAPECFVNESPQHVPGYGPPDGYPAPLSTRSIEILPPPTEL